jgi:septum site-determining protein MinD
MGKVYVVISGKGGVGKTTSAINIGSYMNTLGKEVIIVDANLTTPNVGLHFGSPIAPITLNHVLSGKSDVRDAIYEHESGAKIMPSSLSTSELKNIKIEKLSDVTKKLRKIADHIILDSAAGLGEEAKEAIKASDEIIVIANPEICSITDALKTIKLAEQMKKNVIGVIITRHRGDYLDMKIDTIKDMLEVPILGIIPEDNCVRESLHMKNPVVYTHPKSKAARSYKKIVRRILGPEYIKRGQRIEEEGFFRRFFRKLGFN